MTWRFEIDGKPMSPNREHKLEADSDAVAYIDPTNNKRVARWQDKERTEVGFLKPGVAVREVKGGSVPRNRIKS